MCEALQQGDREMQSRLISPSRKYTSFQMTAQTVSGILCFETTAPHTLATHDHSSKDFASYVEESSDLLARSLSARVLEEFTKYQASINGQIWEGVCDQQRSTSPEQDGCNCSGHNGCDRGRWGGAPSC